MKKRLLSILLALCMVLALLPPGTVFAISADEDDHTPPMVTGVYMNSPGGTVTVEDALYFTVSAEDESGIRSLYLYFTYACEQGHKHTVQAFGGSYSYDPDTKQAKLELTITDDMLNGTYTLSEVTAYDTYFNSVTYYPAGWNYPDDPGNPGDIDFDAIYFVIVAPDVEDIEVSIPASIEVPVRSVYTIRPEVTPAEFVPVWTWTSADTSIATVASSGDGTSCNVTGVVPGVTTITGTTQNGLTVTCTVTVTEAPLPEGGTIDETYQVDVGSHIDIDPVLTPSGATTLYEVSSDNPHVAGIATTGGHTGVRVLGNNPGTATITIRGANNLMMTTTVRVGKESDTQHEKMPVEGHPATCIQPGRTDSVVCSACDYVFTYAKEIPATGEHTWSEWQVTQAATSTTDGLKERRCEVCGESETEVIPATGSTPSTPDTPGTPDTPSTPSRPSRPNTPSDPGPSGDPGSSPAENVAVGDQNLQGTIKDGTVEISATEQQIADIISGAAADGVVDIDISSASNASAVSIPESIISAIVNSTDVSGLSVTAADGNIALSGDALNTVANALTGENDTVTFSVDTVDAASIPATQKYPIAGVLNSAVFIELSASIEHKDAAGKVNSTETIHEFRGSVTVSVPFELPAGMEGREIIACHIADDGSITYFPVKYENGVATFTTTHFSVFAVVESLAAAFKDIDISAWYMLSVEYVLDRGLMGGVGNQKFDPYGTTTRAMFITLLWNLEGKPVVNYAMNFSDVAADTWYTEAVRWGASNNIIGGHNGEFSPNDVITREQLFTMLYNYARFKKLDVSIGETTSILSFNDAQKVSAWANEALQWAVGSGIVDGVDNSLNPGDNASRVVMATLFRHFCERFAS